MSTDDTDAWLRALAGRTDGADAAPEVNEARALRNFMQANLRQEMANAEAKSQVAVADASREAALIARARAAGVLPGTSAPAVTQAGTATGWRWWMQRLAAPRPVLAFATVVALVVLGSRVLLVAPPADTVRGAEHGIVRLQSADPRALKQQITAELTRAGIRVSGYERLGRAGLDADLPLPVSPVVRALLARHRIPVPGDGVLTLEFETLAAP